MDKTTFADLPYSQILLLRHGATAANAAGQYCGRADPGLSNVGKNQIIELRNRLELMPQLEDWFRSNPNFLLISSPLRRCRETAEIIWPGRKPHIAADLIETDFGSWEGMTYEQLKDNSLYRDWLNSNPIKRPAPPAGESGMEIIERLKTAWQRCLTEASATNGQAAIVTHGGIIMYLVSMLTAESANFYKWQLKPGGALLLTKEEIIHVNAADR